MPDPRPVADRPADATIVVRVTPGSDPIAGTVIAGGRERSFLGWVELVGLLEAARWTG